MLFRRQRLEAGEFNVGTTITESVIYNQQFDLNTPTFIDNNIHRDYVEDEIKIALFNSGNSHEHAYYWLENGPLTPSSWTNYNKEEIKYRFMGF